MMNNNLWRSLEAVQGLATFSVRWRELMGADYVAGQAALLRATGRKGAFFPCPRECGCWHEIIEHDEEDIVGICRCDPFCCDDFKLSASEIEIYEVNTARLGRAVARAFGCDVKETELGLPGTWQVASFSGAAIPVVLTIQNNARDFRNIVAQLICKLRERFVLLAPTGRHMDANSLALLVGVNAGFFDLETNVSMLPSGILRADKSGGELFSRFLPEQREMLQEAVAEKVIAMVSKLRSERGKQKAPLIDVFNYLVLDGISKVQAAKQCDCTPGLISLRVKELEDRFGLPVEQLLAFRSVVRERSSSVKGDEFQARRQGARPVAEALPDDRESDFESG